MDRCLVYGCPNSITDNPSIQFHFFPKHPILIQQWLSSCYIWNSDQVDLNLAKICAAHFDDDSYTGEYEMVGYTHYQRILKDGAVPTLALPQQTIVYKAQNVSFADQHYETTGIPIENVQTSVTEQVEDSGVKYGELQSVPMQNGNGIIGIMENTAVEDKYKKYTHSQLEDIKLTNDSLKKEIVKLEKNTRILRKRLRKKKEEYQKQHVEYIKLQRILGNRQVRSMSVAEQKNLLSRVFSESQIKILSGKKKIYWSHDDMAVGYTIRYMSNKRFYLYLNKKLNIPLPGLSSIKRWHTLKKHELLAKEEKPNNCKSDYSNELN